MLLELSKGFMSLMGDDDKDDSTKEDLVLKTLVAQSRTHMEEGDKLHQAPSVQEVRDQFFQYTKLLQETAEKYVSNIQFKYITLPGMHYYLEREDERKNPSWKNRMHRFCEEIDINKIEQLNDDLELANLAYADSVEEIELGLTELIGEFEAYYINVESSPGEPAHYIVVLGDKSDGDDLHVLMGVRGTKSLSDAITDLLCDYCDYRGGKGHGYIVQGGKHLFEKHLDGLEELCHKAGKSRINLKLVGHSLGAGAASIAGMEFNDLGNFTVQVVGFGCPALVSLEQAKKATFITTVVNDNDAVPRCSAATITNLLLDVTEFDWSEYTERDVEHTLKMLNGTNSFIFQEGLLSEARKTIVPKIKAFAKQHVERDVSNRIQPEIFPPGRVIHIYRDGAGMTGCVVGNDFFNEIDVNRRMVDDHMYSTGYQQTFLEIMRQNKHDHHFKFSGKTVTEANAE